MDLAESDRYRDRNNEVCRVAEIQARLVAVVAMLVALFHGAVTTRADSFTFGQDGCVGPEERICNLNSCRCHAALRGLRRM